MAVSGVSLRAALAARVAGHDDAALAALASVGLLRRAARDLTQLTPVVVEADGALLVDIGPHRIRFASADPRAGRCNCRAPGVCQHLLSALLFLRPAAAPAPAAEAQPDAGPAPDALVEAALDRLLAIDDAALRAHAGVSGLRWALDYVATLTPEREVVVEPTATPVLRLPRLGFALHVVGAGLADYVANPPGVAAARHTVAALLAYRRQRGRPLPKLPATAADRELLDARGVLLAEVAREVIAQVRRGLARPSTGALGEAGALAARAQALGAPRLAGLLRWVAAQREALQARHADGDSETLLEALARSYGLAEALAVAQARGDWPLRLAGRTRRDYAETEPLTLIGLAAWRFRSAAGLHGVRLLFHAPDTDEYLGWMLLRPGAARSTTAALLDQVSPWSGLPSPRHVLGQVLQLTGARRAGAQLSSHPGTTVIARRDWQRGDPAPPAVSDWRSDWRAAASVLVGDAEQYACLRPVRWDPARYDPHQQALQWTLYDVGERPLTLTLPYRPWRAARLAAIEAYTSAQDRGADVLVADRGGLIEPLGWVSAGDLRCVSVPELRPESAGVAAAPTRPAETTERPASWPTWLLDAAERGPGPDWPQALGAARDEAEAAGLKQLAALLRPGPDPAEQLLRIALMTLQTGRV